MIHASSGRAIISLSSRNYVYVSSGTSNSKASFFRIGKLASKSVNGSIDNIYHTRDWKSHQSTADSLSIVNITDMVYEIPFLLKAAI